MLSIHLELLDKERKEVFEKLKIFSKTAILGGGTALPLQIVHRLSFDFDLLRIKRTFKIGGVHVNTSEQLTVITDRNVDNYPALLPIQVGIF